MTDTWKKVLILNLPYLLFVYLFEHKVSISALLSSFHIKVSNEHLFLNWHSMNVKELHLAIVKDSYLVLVKKIVILRIFQYCRHIRSYKSFVLANCYDKRRILSYCIYSSWKILEYDTQSI